MKLSVIIPVYNVAPYLRECLDSVCAAVQKLERRVGVGEGTDRPSVEVICVDDGSTDGSGEILDRLVGEMSGSGTAESKSSVPFSNSNSSLQLKVIHQENRGVSAARNAALEMATGDWIGFVDPDDCVAADWFRTAAELVDGHPDAQLVRVRTLQQVWDGQSMSEALQRPLRRGAVSVYRGESARQWGRRRFVRDGSSPLNFLRRDVIGSTRYRVGLRIGEDGLFFLEIARKLSCAVESDHSGYLYRIHADSTLHRFRQTEHGVDFARALLELERPEDVPDFSRALGYNLVRWASEDGRADGYDGNACPLRQLWREETAKGRIRVRALPLWWRPGVRRWLRRGDLGLLMRTWRIRVKVGGWILQTGRAFLGRRWTRQSI